MGPKGDWVVRFNEMCGDQRRGRARQAGAEGGAEKPMYQRDETTGDAEKASADERGDREETKRPR
jgi:hypothetical protein